MLAAVSHHILYCKVTWLVCITNTIVGGSFYNNLHKLKVMY